MPSVRIVADYDSCGYQLVAGQGGDPGRLPVGEALLDRLAGWSQRYEQCDPRAYEDPCGMRFDFVAFAREGLELARAVKRALPHWTVRYWDEAVDWYLARDPRSYVAARAEYEVTLTDAQEMEGCAGLPLQTMAQAADLGSPVVSSREAPPLSPGCPTPGGRRSVGRGSR